MIDFKKSLFSSLLTATLIVSGLTATTVHAVEPDINDIPVSASGNLNEISPQEYVIVTTEGTNDTLLEGMSSYKEIINKDGNTTALLTKAEADIIDAQIPDAVIEPNKKYTLTGTINQATSSWALDKIDNTLYSSDNSYTYDSDGTGIKVFVIDSGITDTSRTTGRLLTGYDGIGDGYGTADCDGHGTFVANLAGGSLYGVAKNVSLVSVRTMDCTGSGYTTDIIAGLNWIINNHSGTKGVINMSLGGDPSTALDNAVQSAIDAGFVVITAAGNGGTDNIGDDTCTVSPARHPTAITVAAINSSLQMPAWTNYGTCVDVLAPGETVPSTTKTGTAGAGNGTSFAAPIVSGVAARYWEENPTYTNTQIMDLLKTTSNTGLVSNATSKSTPDKLVYISGEPTITVPSAPQTLSTTSSTSSSVSLSWTAPASDGGAPVTDYVIKTSSDNGASWVTFNDGVNTNTTATVTGLSMSTNYKFSVTAQNSVGESVAAEITASTSGVALPSKVNNLRVVTNVYGTLTLGWDAPTSAGDSPITDYIITFSRDNGASWTTFNDGVNTNHSFTMKYPATGVYYWFRITPKSDLGTGVAAQTSIKTIALAKPSAPRSLTLKSNLIGKVNLTWLAPQYLGSSPVTDYIIQYSSDNGKTYTTYNDGVSSATSVSITGLQATTKYVFLVKAKNSVGTSPATQITVTTR